MVKIWFGGFYHPRSFEAHWNKYLKHDPHAADHEGNHLSSSTPTGYKNWSNRPHLSIVSKLGSSGSRASPLWVSKVWYLTKSSNSTDPPWNLRHQTQLSNVFNLHDNHKLSSSLIPSNHPKARSKSKITNLGRSLTSGWWSWQKWICPYLKLTIWDPNGFQFGYMPAKNAVRYYRFWIVTLKCTIDFVRRCSQIFMAFNLTLECADLFYINGQPSRLRTSGCDVSHPLGYPQRSVGLFIK